MKMNLKQLTFETYDNINNSILFKIKAVLVLEWLSCPHRGRYIVDSISDKVKKKTLNLVFDAFPVNNTHPSLAIWAVARHYYGVKVLYIPSLSVLYVWFVCLRLVLPMSLNCTSLSVHSVFSNVYLSCQAILSKRW